MRGLGGRSGPSARKAKDAKLVAFAWMLLLGEGAARVRADSRFPKRQRSPIGLRNPHDPMARNLVPKQKRRSPTDASPAVRPQDEKLCQIKILGVVRGWGATGGEREPPKSSADARRQVHPTELARGEDGARRAAGERAAGGSREAPGRSRLSPSPAGAGHREIHLPR